MDKKSLQVGWNWSKVKDKSVWRIPDGFLLRFISTYDIHPANVLDLGCGLGRHTIYFASLGHQVTAIDISEEAVNSTKTWLKEQKLVADVQIGHMTNLNHPNNKFDFVISYNVIYHAYKEDVYKTISEIHRVLKPGGILFCTFLTKDKDSPFREPSKIIAPQTILTTEGPEEGVPHFFSYKEDVLDFLKDFKIRSLIYLERYNSPFEIEKMVKQRGSGHYILFAEKKKLYSVV